MLQCILFTGCNSANDSDTDTSTTAPVKEASLTFNDYCKELFVKFATKDALTLNYLISDLSNYDITQYPDVMVDFDADNAGVDTEEINNIKEKLSTYDYNSLDETQKITYDTLMYYLNVNEAATGLELYYEPLKPTIGIQAELPVTLAEFSFYTKEDICHYLDLLPGIYDLFKEIVTFEKKKADAGLFMSMENADTIITQCQEFADTKEDNYLISAFDKKIDEYDGLTEDERTDYKNRNKDIINNSIIPAYEYLAEQLDLLADRGVNDGGLCKFENGKEYYEYLVKADVGTDKSVDDIGALLDEYIDDNIENVYALYSQDKELTDKKKKADDVLKSKNLTSAESILKHLVKEAKADFPISTDISYELKTVDKSLEDSLSPAMYYKPPVDNATCNSIYINEGSQSDYIDLFSTLAHEGIPGHMLQYNYGRDKATRDLCQYMDVKGVSEGWAKFAEYKSYDYCGLDENVAEVLRTNSKVALCVEARADIGVNYEGWNVSQLKEYVGQFFKVDDDLADNIYMKCIQAPTNTLCYAFGELIFSSMEQEYRENASNDDSAETTGGDDSENAGDGYRLLDFTTAVLDVGFAPFPILYDRIIGTK